MSQVFLRRSDLAVIEAHARRALPREACGLLLGSGDAQAGFTVSRIVPSANVAPPEANDRFEVDPALLLRVHRTLREASPPGARSEPNAAAERILGVYHSHPGGRPEPSAVDCERAAVPGYVWLIAAPHANDSVPLVDIATFLHADGLEPARFVALALVLRDD